MDTIYTYPRTYKVKDGSERICLCSQKYKKTGNKPSGRPRTHFDDNFKQDIIKYYNEIKNKSKTCDNFNISRYFLEKIIS